MSDFAMIKERDDSRVDLAVGEPVFLQQAVTSRLLPSMLANNWDVRYPFLGGNPHLIGILKEYSKSKYVVVTNGAKQGLQGLFALGRQDGKRLASMRKPYWPSYKSLAQTNGMIITDSENFDYYKPEELTVVTSPNNPDGHMHHAFWDSPVDIWDAAYASPLYGYHEEDKVNAVATVYSPTKLFGLSALRIGWVATDDERVARHLAMYVEATTSGVSSVSQQILAKFVKDAQYANNQHLFDEAHSKLAVNFKNFDRILAPMMPQVKSNGNGMFAYFTVSDFIDFAEVLKQAGVRAVNGSACGGSDKEWRFSMGLPNDVTKKALISIAECMVEPCLGAD